MTTTSSLWPRAKSRRSRGRVCEASLESPKSIYTDHCSSLGNLKQEIRSRPMAYGSLMVLLLVATGLLVTNAQYDKQKLRL